MRSPPGTRWAAYGAAVWAFAYAAVSAYWAVGGRVGTETIAADIARIPLANDPVVLWATAGLKVLAGMLALALVRPWGRLLPRRMLTAAVWAAGLLLTLYGGANLVDHGRMVAGLRDTPAVLSEEAARWHLLLWDPVWLLGGVLFLAAAWHHRRGLRESRPLETGEGLLQPYRRGATDEQATNGDRLRDVAPGYGSGSDVGLAGAASSVSLPLRPTRLPRPASSVPAAE